MDEEVVLVEELRAFRNAARNTARHALRKVAGQNGFRYSSDNERQEWLTSIMGPEGRNTGTQPQPPKPLIHKVPETMRDTSVPETLRDTKDFKSYYEPRVVSIGPYHSGNNKLKQVELKYMLLRQFLEKSDYPEGFFDKFAGLIMGVREYYDKDLTKEIDEEAFTRMMFLDGCFILYFIYCIVVHGVKYLGMKNHLIALVQQDLFLLENQLPFKVLMELMSLSDNIPVEKSILDDFVDLNAIGLFTRTKDKQIQEDDPLHLLDLLWKRLLGRPSKIEEHNQSDQQRQKVTIKGHLFRNIKELRAAGIHLRINKTGCLRDVNFRSYGIVGRLTLPHMTIDSSTRAMFLNMAAHEACLDKPDQFGVTSYICFLALLIHHADDVKELRTTDILDNALGSDEEVAKLFKEIAGDLVPDFDTYGDVKSRIQDYLSHRGNMKVASWVADLLRDHFKSPWTIIAVLAAFIAILLTAIQTYYAIHPVPDKCNETICNYLRNKTL